MNMADMRFLKRGKTIIVPLVAVLTTCKSPSNGVRTQTSSVSDEAVVAPNSSEGAQLTGGVINNNAAELKNAGSIADGPFLGGPTGTGADARTVITQASLTASAIPTGGSASPTFGAEPWTQHLLLFEEFGTEAMATTSTPKPFPAIVDSSDPADTEHSTPKWRSAPDKVDIEALIGETGLYPPPARLSNTTDRNPWWDSVCKYISNPRCASVPGPVEGRPPGEGWAHQRWDEFYPQRYFKASQSGARENLGVRDSMQLHKYAVGEFGPGGLYHNTVGAPGFDGTTAHIKPQFHPKMPVQHHHNLWTFDGTFPMKLLMARYDESILFRHYNLLPIDVSANGGFGNHTITTHEHNGHNPSESDGFANAFFFPGQFYDYHWPMAVAGFDSVNTDSTDPLMATPCSGGETMKVHRKSGYTSVLCDVSKDPSGKAGNIKIRGDHREIMSTHWFHDHMMDFTSKNVYKGNAAMMNYYSSIDRGNESVNDGVNLRLPSGSALPWGNRDYDINLAISDKAWDSNGQMWFNPFDTDGFLGDQMLVNLTWRPVLDVRARRYRFRILDAGVARYLKLAVIREISGTSGSIPGPSGSNLSYEPVVFHMIANDGNLMEHTVAFDGTLGTQKGVLPMQGIAERYDIIVDFAKNGIKVGDKVFLVNTMEHIGGRLPNRMIPLSQIMSGAYQPSIDSRNFWVNGDPGVGPIMRMEVKSCVDTGGQPVPCDDQSMDPAVYVENNTSGPGGSTLKMIDRSPITSNDLASAKHHTFEFVRGGSSDKSPWSVKVDNNNAHGADMRRISNARGLNDKTASGLGKYEIWHILNTSGGWTHPVHVHFEEGQVLKRGGNPPPIWEKYARKDMYRVGPDPESTASVEMAIRVREFAGEYMEHCHNTTHEDNAMLVRWDNENPGQLQLMPAPSPTWFGVNYVDSVAEETFRNGNASLMTSSYVSLDGVVAPGQVMAVTGKGLNCSFVATMQNDGNFVLNQGAIKIWQTGTAGKAAGGSLRFLADGSLALRGVDNKNKWTAAHGKGGRQFLLEGTGRLVVRNPKGAIVWQSNAPVKGCSM